MEESPHILVVDDDPQVLNLTGRFLKQFNFRVTTTSDAKHAYAALAEWNIDCLVLDIMLPDEDGYSILKNLCQQGDLPIIMLIAMRDDTDRILGLELGADDYLTKPFNLRELMARIRAGLRRVAVFGMPSPEIQDRATVKFESYILNFRTRELRTVDGKSLSLSDREFSLLSVFARYPDKVMSRDQLADFVHHSENDPLGRRIDLLVSRLRCKIEKDVENPRIIQTVWGKGYKFCAAVSGIDE